MVLTTRSIENIDVAERYPGKEEGGGGGGGGGEGEKNIRKNK